MTFRIPKISNGVFSGWNSEKKSYDPASWLYEGAKPQNGKEVGTPRAGESDGGHSAGRVATASPI